MAERHSRERSAESRNAATTASTTLTLAGSLHFIKTLLAAILLMAVHLGLTDTACRWQMAKEKYDRPNFFVAENALRGRHARRRDSVVDHPLQLPVGVALYLRRGQRRKRR